MATEVVPQVQRPSGASLADLKQILRRGLAHHQAGELPQALGCYQSVLAIDHDQPDALNLIGVVAHQTGDHALAVNLLERAVSLDSKAPDFVINLGLARQAIGDLTGASEAFNRAVNLRPASPQAHLHLGTARRLLGDPAGAVRSYDRALALAPELAEAHATRGAALHTLGREAEAERSLRRALEIRPDFAEALSDLGSLLQSAGRMDEAMACYHRALQLKPDLVDAHSNLGTGFAAAGDHALAIECYRRALTIAPSHFESLVNLGMALQVIGQLDDAAAAFEAARIVRPTAREPYLHLGAIHQAQNRLAESLEALDTGLTQVGLDAELLAARGTALRHLERLDEAIAAFRAALALAPSARIETNLGNALLATGDFDGALAAVKRAEALDPAMAEAFLSHGNILKAQGDLDGAVARYADALRIRPGYAEAEFNTGNTWREAGQYVEAIAAYERALKLNPEYGAARWNLALALLGHGELARGFAEYEWRWRDGDRFRLPALVGGKLWAGEPVAGKHLLVWREQGLGDELLFLTCLPDLIAAGARVTVVVSPRLVTLVARAFPTVEVVPDQPGSMGDIGRFDWHVPMGSLPRWFRATRSAFPAAGHYLKPDPKAVPFWTERLAAHGSGPRIGICWRSGLLTPERARHYAPWREWLPLWQVPGVTWVNLQYDDCDAELVEAEAVTGVRIHRWPGVDLKNDLESVIALLSCLDLVVTAPTAVSSLAGAVGTPTWQLDNGSDWTVFGEKWSPWFPSIRLMRKRAADRSWGPLLQRLGTNLNDAVRAGEVKR